MHKALVCLIFSLAFVFRLNAQQALADNPKTSSSTVLPDEPQAKTDAGDKENLICPGGAGKPCALLGGRTYYPDLWKMTQHNHTWGEAMKSPAIVGASALLIGTTVLDIEGTDHCLPLHTCRESNPLLPKTVDRPRQYATAMSLDALAIAFMGRQKKRGKGNVAFAIVYAGSVMHFYFGTMGLHDGLPKAPPATGSVKH